MFLTLNIFLKYFSYLFWGVWFGVWFNFILLKTIQRKRHTIHRVVSTPSVVLTGYPPPPGRIPQSWPGWGRGVPCYLGTPRQGAPQQGTPWAGYPRQGTPWQGTPTGVCPMEFWVMLQSIVGYGYPPVDRQTDTCQNITFPSYHVRGR